MNPPERSSGPGLASSPHPIAYSIAKLAIAGKDAPFTRGCVRQFTTLAMQWPTFCTTKAISVGPG